MSIDPRDEDILILRDRMIERNPGLRESFQRFLDSFQPFLRDWEKYLETMEGTPTSSAPREYPHQKEGRWEVFRYHGLHEPAASGAEGSSCERRTSWIS